MRKDTEFKVESTSRQQKIDYVANADRENAQDSFSQNLAGAHDHPQALLNNILQL